MQIITHLLKNMGVASTEPYYCFGFVVVMKLSEVINKGSISIENKFSYF